MATSGTGAMSTGGFTPFATRPTVVDNSILQAQQAAGRNFDRLIPYSRTQNNYIGPWINGGASQIACGNPVVKRNANCMFKAANPLRQFGDYIEQFYLIGQNAAKDIYQEVGGVEGFQRLQADMTTTQVSSELVKSILDTSGAFTKAKAQTALNTSMTGLSNPDEKNKVLDTTLQSLLRIVGGEATLLNQTIGTMGYTIKDLQNPSTWGSLSESEKITYLVSVSDFINNAISSATTGAAPTNFPVGTSTSANPSDIIRSGVVGGTKVADMLDGVAKGDIAGLPIGSLVPAALSGTITSYPRGAFRSAPFAKSLADVTSAMKTGNFSGVTINNPTGATVPLSDFASFKSFVTGLPAASTLSGEQAKLAQAYQLLLGIYEGALAGSVPATTGGSAKVQKETPLPTNIQGLKDRANDELTQISDSAPNAIKKAMQNSEACKTLTDNMFCLAQEISGLNVWDPGAAAAAERAFSMAEALATTGIQSALAQLFGTNTQAILDRQQAIDAAQDGTGVEGQTQITEDPMALLLHQTVGVIKTLSENVYKPAKDRIKTSLETFKTNMQTANGLGKDAMKVQGGGGQGQ